MNQRKHIKWLSISFLTFFFLLSLPFATFAASTENTTESDLTIKYDCSSTATQQIWKIQNPTTLDYNSNWPNGGYWINRNAKGQEIQQQWLPNIPAGGEVTLKFDITDWGTYSGQNIPARLDITDKNYKLLQYKLAVCEVKKKIEIQFVKTEGTKTYFSVTNTTDNEYKGLWYAFVKNSLYANDGSIIIPNDGQPHDLVVNYWNLKDNPLTKLILSAPDSGWLGALKPPLAVWIP